VIKEKEMKSHIKRCRGYIGIAYRQVMEFRKNIPVLELKVCFLDNVATDGRTRPMSGTYRGDGVSTE
jgi:hypothetical protein